MVPAAFEDEDDFVRAAVLVILKLVRIPSRDGSATPSCPD